MTNQTIPLGVDVWDSTKLKSLLQCEQQFVYKYVDGWRGKGFSPAMLWGQAFHEVCELFDHLTVAQEDREEELTRLVNPFELFMAGTLMIAAQWEEKLFSKLDPKDTKRSKVNFIKTAEEYWNRWWGKEPFKTLIVDGQPATELHGAFTYGGEWFSYYIDRVVETSEGGVYVVDRKTTGASLNENAALNYFAKYEMDVQMILYTEAMSRRLGREVDGVIIDAIQPLVNESRFKKFPLRFTKERREEMMEHLLHTIERYKREVRPAMNFTSCDGMFSCGFKNVCKKRGGSRQLTLETDYTIEERWDPREPRESVISKLGGWNKLKEITHA